jgi:hypothetical protein
MSGYVKKCLLIACLLLCFFPSITQAGKGIPMVPAASGTEVEPAGGYGLSTSGSVVVGTTLKLGQYTVATLPTCNAGAIGRMVRVTDGDDGTDCTTGGGSDRVLCECNGSVWASVDTQAAGSAEVSDADVAAAGNTDTTHSYSKDDIHDYAITGDTDLDGLADTLDYDVAVRSRKISLDRPRTVYVDADCSFGGDGILDDYNGATFTLWHRI